jgi:hypothetical protein
LKSRLEVAFPNEQFHEQGESMSTKTIVVKGGGSNLYSTSESSGTIYVFKGSGWGKTQIGKVKRFEDALALIKSHSGKEIERIE